MSFKLRARYQKVLLVVLGIVLPLLVIDLGLRIWFTCCGSERQRIMYVYSPAQIRSANWRFQALPYLNYGLSPDYPTHNSLGYRGAEIELPKPEGMFRIVTLGGSTTYGFGIPDWQQAYPAQLEQILRQTYGYTHIEVINAGVEWYTTWEMLVNLAFRVLDLDPDLIILYEATNDVSYRLIDPEQYSGLNLARGIWRTDYSDLGPSVLYRLIALNLELIPNPASLQNQISPLESVTGCGLVFRQGEPFCADLDISPVEVLAANPPVYYERNLRNIIAIARANGVQVMLSTWAYFPDPIEDLPYENYLAHRFWQGAIAEHNRVTARIAAELDVPYHDLAGQMPYNPDFWIDGAHLTPQGTREQASQYAAFLVQQGLIAPQ